MRKTRAISISTTDAVVLQAICLEPGAAGVVRADLQPGKLSPPVDAAIEDQTLVSSKPVGEADQDRRESRPKRSLHHLPDGGGGRLQKNFRGNPGTDQSITMLYDVISPGTVKIRGIGLPKQRF